MSAELKPLDIEKERAEFEAAAKTITHASDRDIEREGDGYSDYILDTYWRFWLAAKRSTTPAVTGEAGGDGLTKAQIDAIVYRLRQDEQDTTYNIVNAAIAAVKAAGGGVTDEVRVTLEAAADYLDEYRNHLYNVKLADIEAHPYPPAIEQVASELRAIAAAGQGGEDARDAARYRFRKQFLASGGAIHFGSFGCQLRRPGELVSTGATEEEAIDAALTNKADGGEA